MGLSVSQLVHTPAHLTQNQVILCRKKGQCLSYPAGTGINESARRFAIRGGEHGEVFGLLS